MSEVYGRTIVLLALLIGAASSQAHGQERLPIWRVAGEPDLRIGAVDGPAALTAAMWVMVSSGGDVYVAEPSSNVVHVFDRNGRKLRQVGSSGDGPGEFRNLFFTGLRRDTLWAVDIRHRRVSLFTSDGNLISTLPFTRPMEKYRTPVVSASLAEEMFLAEPPTSAGSADINAPRDSVPMLLLRKDGSLYGVMGWRRQGAITMQVPAQAGSVPIRLPVVAQQQFVASPDGSMVLKLDGTSADRVELTAFSPKGAQLWRRAYTLRPTPISRSRKREMVEQTASRIKSRFASEAAAEAAVESSVRFPDHFPAAHEARIGADGTLWLQVGDPIHNDWLVLTAAGELRARIRLPPSYQLKAVTAEAVYGVVRDELDVPYVLRYRLTKS